jgi:hypothetical protein
MRAKFFLPQAMKAGAKYTAKPSNAQNPMASLQILRKISGRIRRRYRERL